MFKEYSLEVRTELPQTKVADSQPSPRAGRSEGLSPDGACYLAGTNLTHRVNTGYKMTLG